MQCSLSMSTSRAQACSRLICLAVALGACLAAPPGRLHAQTSTWTRTTDGNWSLAGNWDLLPTGGSSTTLTFNGSGSQSYVATNDLADPFFLNQIVLNSTLSGTPTIAGAKIRFVGTGAKIRQDGSGAFQFTAPLKFDVPLTLAGFGTGFVTLNGALSGMGGIVKTGSSMFVFGTPSPGVLSNNTFAGGLTLDDGTIRFANAQDSGPTVLRSNRLTLASATASLLYGGTDFNTTTEIRLGELSGVAGSLFQARTINVPSPGERGLNVLITALGNAEFAGTFTNTGTGVADGSLKVRGFGNQTISGTFNINNDIEVFHGATLTLANSASIGTLSAGRIYVSGGTFVLDARAMSGNNLIRDGNASNGGIDGTGGGTFRFIGKAAGSTETLGRLEIGDGSLVRSGALHIELVHNAGSTASTVLTFLAFERSSGQPSRSTVDFAAFDGSGTTMLLGQTSSNPRIILSGLTATNLINSLLSRTGGSGLASVSGYATVNGTDFATYNTTNGITAVTAFPWTGSASSTTNFRLSADGNTGGASSAFAVSSLKLDSTTTALTLNISGSGNLQTNGILLAGSNDASITSSGGGAWIGFGARYAHVRQAVLTISASIADVTPLVKAGGGTLVLSSTANSASTATLTINEGVVRGDSSALPSGTIELRGGVLEISGGGTLNRALGTGTNSINWNGGTTYDKGSGGFSAFGAGVIIDLKNTGTDDIWWRDTGFVDEGFALVFGSKTSDARVSLVDNLGLSEAAAPAIQTYNAREIQVVDNPNSSADFARLSGIVSGDATEDLLKTGAGILELSGANTYYGGTIVAEGSLLLANASALGDGTGAYVLLGARSGAADIALLASRTSGSITIARDLLVQSGSSGLATIGNTIAPDAATTADAVFSGNILVGLQGDSLAKGLKFNAVTGTTVTFSGAVSTHPGYSGSVSLQKTGYCPLETTHSA